MSLGTRTILATLSLERLRTLARDFDAGHLWPMTKADAIDNLEKCLGTGLQPLLDMLLFDELAKACKVAGLDPKAYRREVLVTRLIEADGKAQLKAPVPIMPPAPVMEAGPSAVMGKPAKRLHRAARPAAPQAPRV